MRSSYTPCAGESDGYAILIRSLTHIYHRLQVRCQQGKDSVPRNRVYTHYAQRCGNDRVDTLNPASFGKLVRIIFPGIQTRRLGQRGESKYHYVNLILLDEQQAEMNQPNGTHGYGPLQIDGENWDDR